MASEREAFNVELLKLDEGQLRVLPRVEVIDTFESPGSSDFHPKGLFSSEIFGKVGEEQRDTTFASIHLKTKIIHPFIYRTLGRIRRFYIDIIEGQRYAVFDQEKKDFVPSNADEGETGFSFFIRHWDDLVIPKTDSDIRNQRVELFEKYRDKALLDAVVVMPAGLRDAEINEEGRIEEDEINSYYRRLIGASTTIGEIKQTEDPSLNITRKSQQKNFNAIFDHIQNLLKDKSGFIQGKWGKRGVIGGTRNVITAMDSSPKTLDDPSTPNPDQTVLGLYQVSKGAQPLVVNRLRNTIISDAFGTVEGQAKLVNPKTYRSEFVSVPTETFDRWSTVEGLEKVINEQSIPGMRSKPIRVETEKGEYYLGLVYKPKNEKVFKVFKDIDELPEGFDRESVYPITLMELIYLSNYWGWNDLGVQIVRYPVTGEESSYVSKVFIRTTVKSESRVELTDTWEYPDDVEGHTALVYPIFEPEAYVDSAMVHPHRLGGLGGDYDGDTISANILYSQEAVEEIDRHLQTRQAHIDPSGGLRASASTDTAAFVMHNLTGSINE